MTQFAEVLGAGLNALLPPGIISGGEVTAGVGLTVVLADDTRIWVAGVVFRLNGAVTINDIDDDATTLLWATIKRTPANPAMVHELDAYDLIIAPSATRPERAYFPLAEVTAVAGAVTDVVEPSGKYQFKRTIEVITTLDLWDHDSVAVDHSADFIRQMVGHTQVTAIDQDNVEAYIDPNSLTPEGFIIDIESVGEPTSDDYLTATDLRLTVDCYGHFLDM